MMQHIDSILDEVIIRLRAVGLEKLILFGSYAHGTPNDDSDIDLLVVTNGQTIPQTFKEKNAIYQKFAGRITAIQKKVPIDMIVHTKAMHEKFIDMKSIFSRRIISEGKILYENSH